MDFKELTLEIQDAIAVITMNNPDKLNPFTIRMGQEFRHAFYECEYNEAVRSVVLTGSGRAFCSGGDIRGMIEYEYPKEPKAVFLKEITIELHNTVKTIRRLPKPVIAAVNGVASGAGFSLALASDLIIAADNARFNLAYVNIGLHPDGGASYFLPRLIGVHKTRELVFTGEFISASEAVQLNIVNKVEPPEKLLESAMTLARKLAAGPTVAIGLAKAAIDRSLEENLEGQLENERQAIAKAGMTKDFLEGISAFMEKRKPKFQGK